MAERREQLAGLDLVVLAWASAPLVFLAVFIYCACGGDCDKNLGLALLLVITHVIGVAFTIAALFARGFSWRRLDYVFLIAYWASIGVFLLPVACAALTPRRPRGLSAVAPYGIMAALLFAVAIPITAVVLVLRRRESN